MLAVSLLFLWISSVGFGENKAPPEARSPGVDTKLVGEDPRAFFEKRMADQACADELDGHYSQYRKLRAEMEELKGQRDPASALEPKYDALNDQIDQLEKRVLLERNKALALLPKCGKCAARPIEPWVVNVTGSQRTWYISDASCQVAETDPGKLQTAFEAIRDSLLDTRRYPRHLGGFDSVIDFQIVEAQARGGQNQTFTFKPDAIAFPDDRFNLAIWVKGPNLGFPTAFHYLMDGWTEAKSTDDFQEFALRFKTVAPALSSRVRFPNMQFKSASGRGSRIRVNEQLHHVEGWWYANSEGYTRYFIQAQLTLPETLVQTMGMGVLMATVLELSDRGETE